MIEIRKSKSADTRSAEKPVDLKTLTESSLQHIGDVQAAMYWMSSEIKKISRNHDFTKIDSSKEFHDDFAAVQADKSKDFCSMKWYQKHITEERHHLDKRVPDDINLFDVMERIADIVMAGMARAGNVYDDNLPAELLQRAYKNTIELLKKEIVVEE